MAALRTSMGGSRSIEIDWKWAITITYHALSAAPFSLSCNFFAFNMVSCSCKFFVSHIVLNSSSHFSIIPCLNFSSNFFGLNVVLDAFKMSFTLTISLSLHDPKRRKIIRNLKKYNFHHQTFVLFYLIWLMNGAQRSVNFALICWLLFDSKSIVNR